MKECTQTANSFHYNYFFYGVDEDYIQALFGDLKKYPNVHFHPYGAGTRNPLIRTLFKIHWSAKLNSRVRLPFKRIWFRKMCSYDFKNDLPICYIFLGGQYIAGNSKLQNYIWARNPDNRIVIQYEDLIRKKNYKNFELVRASADYLVTYDADEAKDYHICLFDKQIYSPIQEPTQPSKFDYDVYFLGFAKDRLDLIHRIYRKLSADGLKCCFIICGTKPEDRIEADGIIYSQPIPYAKNISYLQKSRCVLELVQAGSDGFTLRTQESICYHRKLLTNHLSITKQSFYEPGYISTFSDETQIDTKFLTEPINESLFENAPDLSPDNYLTFLEQLLEEP